MLPNIKKKRVFSAIAITVHLIISSRKNATDKYKNCQTFRALFFALKLINENYFRNIFSKILEIKCNYKNEFKVVDLALISSQHNFFCDFSSFQLLQLLTCLKTFFQIKLFGISSVFISQFGKVFFSYLIEGKLLFS